MITTEILIVRGERVTDDNGESYWKNGKPDIVKRAIVNQDNDVIADRFLDAVHSTISKALGSMYDDWKVNQSPNVKKIVTGVRGAFGRGRS